MLGVAAAALHVGLPHFRYEFGLRCGCMFKIKRTRKIYPCPICGYGLPYPPCDFNSCPSCGVEFGYQDIGRSYDDLRNQWARTGAHWASRVVPAPPGWNPWMQLIEAYRRTSNRKYLDAIPFQAGLEFRFPRPIYGEMAVGRNPGYMVHFS